MHLALRAASPCKSAILPICLPLAGEGTTEISQERAFRMPVEIERKFLVTGDAWRRDVSRSERMAQGYLAGPPASKCSVRVRIAGDVAHLNIKSVALGVARDEYEYEIPLA